MPSGPDPITNQRRKARRQAKLPPDAACVLCGITTPEVLLLVGRSLLEAHHVLGMAYAGELTVPLCRNCHAVETEGMRDLGIDLKRQSQQLPDMVVHVFRALGRFFTMLGQRLLEWADQVAALCGALDREYAGWRQLPEAQA